jgi:UDP-N-acetylglucosamine diphosphorylase/glucosamine-1-phosphate N-acetyltransferase
MFTMRERIEIMLGTKASLLITAPHLMGTAAELVSKPDDFTRLHLDLRGLSSEVPILFLRSTLIPSRDLAGILQECGPGTLLLAGGAIAGFIIPPLSGKVPLDRIVPPRRDVIEELSGGRVRDVDSSSILLDGVWEIVRENGRLLSQDFEMCAPAVPASGDLPPGVFAREAGNVWIAEGALVHPHVFLDASAGPIYISEGARILPFTSLEGPAFVGRGSTLAGAFVRGGSSIGPMCRIGGEVDSSIFQGYANKAHGGFIGHSVLGEWVNLGAGTTNSDLKNTYGPVRITTHSEVYDTGMLKMGALIGDHVKTGIGTLIDTGAVFGTGANVFGGGIQPKLLPPFVWGGDARFEEYRLEAFMKTAETVMARRGISLTENHKQLIEKIHRSSSAERTEWLARRGGKDS